MFSFVHRLEVAVAHPAEELAKALVVPVVPTAAIVSLLARPSLVDLVRVVVDLVQSVEDVAPLAPVQDSVAHPVVVALAVRVRPPLLAALINSLPTGSVAQPNSDRGPMEQHVVSAAMTFGSAEAVVAS